MLEGVDARVHYIGYTPEMESARVRGELRPNAFVRLRKVAWKLPTGADQGGRGDLVLDPSTAEKNGDPWTGDGPIL